MQAYRLTKEVQDEGFSGGSLSYANGLMFDVGKALEEGDGVIYTDDDVFAAALAAYPALERVPNEDVSKDAQPVAVPGAEEAAAAAPVGAPWIGQTPGDQEIPAEHAEEPETPEQAVAVGEAVSGSKGIEEVSAPSTKSSPSSSKSASGDK